MRRIHTRSGGNFPIIGVGGIMSPADAKAMLDAGADLLQLYTGYIYEGPGLVGEICRSLIADAEAAAAAKAAAEARAEEEARAAAQAAEAKAAAATGFRRTGTGSREGRTRNGNRRDSPNAGRRTCRIGAEPVTGNTEQPGTTCR